ncbi:claudin-4-like [Salvelinus fontinalis]|uniref:claudin-4-like n=1 Tax=Salvelinus fontinalis TaxID=8038 RepID=UPI002485F7DD|nr:claudin-4-like [Salvelinus fontinalis]
MGRIGKEVLGQVLSFIGFVGVAVTTGIPMWRVTTYIGANIVTGQIVWDGLWMNCVMQSTGQMQCKINDSMMRLATDLQAARALVIISIIFNFVGLIVTFIGGQCTSTLKSESSKGKVTILGGILLLIGALLVLIPVCWSAAFTISDFNNPLTIETQRREIGASIYIGWGSTALLLIGGIILCTSCPPQKMYGYPGYPQGAPMYPYPGQPMDLQAARALSVIAIIASCFGILLGISGGKCTNFVEDEASKAKVAIASGIIFIVAGVLILVPVCWSANTIIRDFYNPLLVEAQRRELGASLYIGWGTAGLLILGGGLLCSSCPPKEERDDYPVKYSQARSTATSRAYV